MRVFMTPSCSSLGGDVGEALQRHLELGVLVSARDLEQLVAGEHELRHHRHQVLERLDIHPQRLAGELGFGLFRLVGGLRGRGRLGGRGGRGLRLGGGLAEGALELVERHLADPQRALEHLIGQAAGSLLRLRRRRRRRGGGRRGRVEHHALELADEICVRAGRLGLLLLELVEDLLDAVDGGEDERHGLAGHRHAVAEFAHQGLGRVRKRLESRQAEKSARALDGVDEAEDVVQDLAVVGFLLELHEFDVDRVQALAGFGEEFTQQVVHRYKPSALGASVRPAPFESRHSVLGNPLRLVAGALPRATGNGVIQNNFFQCRCARARRGRRRNLHDRLTFALRHGPVSSPPPRSCRPRPRSSP
jgi:hypothetical protein